MTIVSQIKKGKKTSLIFVTIVTAVLFLFLYLCFYYYKNKGHSTRILIKEAEEYLSYERYQDAEKILRKIIENNRANEWVYIQFIRTLRKQRKYPEALTWVKKVEKEISNPISLCIETAAIYTELRKFEEAEKLCKKIIQLEPYNYQALVCLGWIYREKGENLKSLKCLEQAVTIDAQDSWGKVELAFTLMKLNELKRAEDLFRELIKTNPQSYASYAHLGLCLKAQGRLIEAANLFRKALELNPEIDWISQELMECSSNINNIKNNK